MGKISCKCGENIQDIAWPSENAGFLITDYENEINPSKIERIGDIGRSVWECGNCGRLAISFPDKKSGHIKYFKPEDGCYIGLLKLNLKGNE